MGIDTTNTIYYVRFFTYELKSQVDILAGFRLIYWNITSGHNWAKYIHCIMTSITNGKVTLAIPWELATETLRKSTLKTNKIMIV